ncbi:MAG TPA: prephenate dehydrogenase/arogenate dehydrogenase family protein [Steroidobacteraceae bacterium]|nr:prephenate dehydrogenase/arogenate dehydrogenase family protein [Steroidobacteraceae bacterium]
MNLDTLREQLDALDHQLIEIAAERQRLSTEIARIKRERNLPTRDFSREREVILRGREEASRLGVSPELAEALLRPLIHASLATQEQARIAAHGQGTGKRALVIGGKGKMGGWFVEFLASQGYAVEVADPAGPVKGFVHHADWQADALEQDLILLATPLGTTTEVLQQLAKRRPRGVVFDIGSLKTPLRVGLEGLVRAGCHVTSIHPMFGPDTNMLSGRHVIFIDLGSARALGAARELFAPTMVEQVVMSLDDHDRLIAYVLGLSHALNIAFFTALAESGQAAPQLARLSSTTFDAQLDVASRVAAESPSLYFEIQSLNQYGGESLAALQAAVARLSRIVAAGNESEFASLMMRGKAYLDGRSTVRTRN